MHAALEDNSLSFFWHITDQGHVVVDPNSELYTSLDLDGIIIAGMSGLFRRRVPTVVWGEKYNKTSTCHQSCDKAVL